MMKKNITKQLSPLKKEALLAVKGGRQDVPDNFYAPTAPAFGIWEEFDIRFDGGDTGGAQKLPGINNGLTSILVR